MADCGKLPPTAVRYKRLSEINLGGKMVRFLGVNEENQAVYFPKSPVGCGGRLLFLACDVVAATSSITRNNHIRVHVKFSKLGLASKIRLVGFKIEHITSSTPVWFYNIKGLFRVAFELGTDLYQKDCLALLQTEWLKRFNERPLEVESHIRYNLRLKMDNVYKTNNTTLETMIIRFDKEPTNKQVDNDNDKSNVPYGQELEAYSSRTTHEEEECDYYYIESKHFDVANGGRKHLYCTDPVISDCIVEINPASSSDNLEEEMINDAKIGEPTLDRESFFENFDAYLKNALSRSNAQTQALISQVVITSKYLQNMKGDDLGVIQDSNYIIFHFMSEYLALINDQDSVDNLMDHFGLTREMYTMMFVICDWLGQRFHHLGFHIGQRVSAFQHSNIHNVHNLPPPEETINTLYPSFMKRLIINWMGEVNWMGKHDGHGESSCFMSDHDYCPGVRTQMLEKNVFPLAQLVLEFLTNLPISGITLGVLSRVRATERT